MPVSEFLACVSAPIACIGPSGSACTGSMAGMARVAAWAACLDGLPPWPDRSRFRHGPLLTQPVNPLAADRAQVDVGRPGMDQAAWPQQRSGDLARKQRRVIRAMD